MVVCQDSLVLIANKGMGAAFVPAILQILSHGFIAQWGAWLGLQTKMVWGPHFGHSILGIDIAGQPLHDVSLSSPMQNFVAHPPCQPWDVQLNIGCGPLIRVAEDFDVLLLMVRYSGQTSPPSFLEVWIPRSPVSLVFADFAIDLAIIGFFSRQVLFDQSRLQLSTGPDVWVRAKLL